MRRYTNLKAQICDPRTLDQACRLAARGKRRRPSVSVFLMEQPKRLRRLRDALWEGEWRPSPPSILWLRDPKPRPIVVAPFEERVVHHALCDVIDPLLARSYLPDTYACLSGRGTHRAILQLQRLMGKHRNLMVADVRKYFPSIDHKLLLNLLGERFPDTWVLNLCARILHSAEGLYMRRDILAFIGDPAYRPALKRGLPIGALTSQVWGNFYLSGLDHFIKRELKAPGYIRYMDNLTCLGASRGELKGHLREITAWLKDKRGLSLRRERVQYLSCAGEVLFLGHRVGRGGDRLDKGTLARMGHRLERKLRHKTWPESGRYLEDVLTSWKGIGWG